MKEKNKIKIYLTGERNKNYEGRGNFPLWKTKDKLDPPPQVFSDTLSKQLKKKRRGGNGK